MFALHAHVNAFRFQVLNEGGAEIVVYPRDTDRKGVRNATKAYVINYGRGKRRGKLGDRFITGKLQQTEEKVFQAMQAESDRILDELNN